MPLQLSPLPEVEAVIDDFNRQASAGFGWEGGRDPTALQRSEVRVLATLVHNAGPTRSVEIGLASGLSCAVIATVRRSLSLGGRHVALDPYQRHFNNAGLAALERLGLSAEVEHLEERSEDFLHRARHDGETFDFAFVDGGHDIGQKLTDAFYLSQVMRPDSIVAFHDGMLLSTATAVRYLVKECGYTLISLPADNKVRGAIRRARHLPALGWWYASQVIPHLCCSLVALKSPLVG